MLFFLCLKSALLQYIHHRLRSTPDILILLLTPMISLSMIQVTYQFLETHPILPPPTSIISSTEAAITTTLHKSICSSSLFVSILLYFCLHFVQCPYIKSCKRSIVSSRLMQINGWRNYCFIHNGTCDLIPLPPDNSIIIIYQWVYILHN